MDTDRFMTVRQVADLLHCTTQHVRRLVHFDKIPSHKVGKRRLFDVRELDEWIAAGGATITEADETKHRGGEKNGK